MMNKHPLLAKLISLVAVCTAIGLSATAGQRPESAAALEAPVENAYTIVDTNQDKLGYERICTMGYNTDGPNEEFSYSKTIIAFDTPETEFEAINRLTMRITYHTYKPLDVFHWFPIWNEKTFIIRSTDGVMPALEPRFNGDDWLGWGLNLLPSIGKVSSLIAYEEVEPYGFISDSDNVTNTWKSKFVRESNLFGKEHYVILPVSRTLLEVWISIDGYTVDNIHISDGLGEDGLPTSNESGNYITVSDLTSPSINFTSAATITQIDVRGMTPATGDSVVIQFGNYDYVNNAFPVFTASQEFTHDELFVFDEPLPIGDDFEGVVTFFGNATAELLIYYEAETPAVYVNIVDTSGLEQPTTIDGDAIDLAGQVSEFWYTLLWIVGVSLVCGAIILIVIYIVIPLIAIYHKKEA